MPFARKLKYHKSVPGVMVMVIAFLFFFNLPFSSMNPGRQLEYESVYKTYELTHVLLARPGSDNSWPNPKIQPFDHKNLGRGGSLDDPGIYLLPFLTVPLHISNPSLAIHWVMVFFGCLTLVLLLPIISKLPRPYRKRRFLWLLVPGLFESLSIVPLASSWTATPSNYSIVGELSLIALLLAWHYSNSKNRKLKYLNLFVLSISIFLLILTRRSAGLEIEFVSLLIIFLSLLLKKPWTSKSIETSEKRKFRSIFTLVGPLVLVVLVYFFANLTGTVAVRDARNSSASHLTFQSGISSHSFWGVIYTGLGWRPTKNGLSLSSLGVVWSDSWVENKLHSLAPQISADDPRRETVAKNAVFKTIESHPISFLVMILEKIIESLWLTRWWLILLLTAIFFNRRDRNRKTKEIRKKEFKKSKHVTSEKQMSKILEFRRAIPNYAVSILIFIGTIFLVADSLLGAPYLDYLTSLNAWFCFWTIYYFSVHSVGESKIKVAK